MIVARVLALAVLLCAGAAPAAEDATLERGRYLVTTIMACGNCRTPNDAQGNAIAAHELAGGGIGFDIPPFEGVAANIAPDREAMPFAWYAGIRADDLAAIVVDFRRLPPLAP